jgi:hypothetical protein
MPTDKAVVDEMREEATVVFDDSMIGKDIDAITDPKLSLDFKDGGRMNAPRGGQENLMCLGQRVASEKYMHRYEEMAWMCDDCGEMHPKGEECEEL